MNEPHPPLLRTIGPVQLVLYGIGSMLGAGIYALIGDAARLMGNAIWMAFVVSMIAAVLTALSYACLGSRYPRAAGAAYAAHRAYRRPMLTYVVGLAVVASGLTSMATGSKAIGGELVKLGLAGYPRVWAFAFLFLLAIVVFRGIRESMILNIICTIIEAGGLLFVIAVGARYWGNTNLLEGPPQPDGSSGSITTVILLSGAVLTFFSFIGFEDILNVAEECKKPETTVPIGLVGAMLGATVIYLLIAVTAVSVIPARELSGGNLRNVVARAAPWFPPKIFSVITIFSIANSALLNFVMGSRLIYGMSRQGLLPAPLGRVHARRRTPHVSIVVLLLIVLTLVLVGELSQLASATSLLLLTVFTVVNAGLVLLKFRPTEPKGRFEVPWIVPALGTLVCCTLIATRVLPLQPGYDWRAPMIAGVFIVGAALLYVVLRPKHVLVEEDGPTDAA